MYLFLLMSSQYPLDQGHQQVGGGSYQKDEMPEPEVQETCL